MTDHTTVPAPVVVVGARVAGAATALLLARQSHDVLVLDRAAMPSDTLSSHGLFRPGTVQLQRYGLLDALVASGAPPIREVSYRLDGFEVRKGVRERAGVDAFLAPRRHVLDSMLLDAAVAAGARFESGVSATGVWTDWTGRVAGVEVRREDGSHDRIPAAFVVGADGIRSRIAGAVGAPVLQDRGTHGATHYAYVADLDLDGYEMFIADGTLAGIFPTHHGEANVWVFERPGAELRDVDRTEKLFRLLATAAPELAERVRAARLTSPVRSAAGLPNQVRQAAGPGWALVGDAGCHRDPITGHGITDALVHAELLAEQLSSYLRGEVEQVAALAEWTRRREAALAPTFELSCRMGTLPPVEEFMALYVELEQALEAEAAELAARGPLVPPISVPTAPSTAAPSAA